MQNSLHSKRFRNPVRRILMLLAGIECATFGISCTALSGLGTTPISSLPFVLSKIFPLTFGTTTFILNVFFVLIEAMLLRSRFTVLNLLQIPAVLVFGLFIDLNMMLLGAHAPDDWVMGLAMSVVGSVVLAVGVFLQIRSKTIVQPGEGVVIVYAAVLRKSFGTMKVVNDVALVIIAAILSLAVLGTITGIREGTVISAFLVGFLVKGISHFFPEPKAGDPHQVDIEPAGKS
ncbi:MULTISPECIES: YitT family protein [Sutterella]|nr:MULTISPECIES: DUF6198 family protein [Sutterella]